MATVFEDKNMSYYAKQTFDFSKMPEPLVDKIVNFYVSIMNEIDNLKRDDLNYDLEDYLYFKDEDKSELRNLAAENVYFYLNELDPDTEKELKKYVPANSYSDPCENYYMFKIDECGHASLDDHFNLNNDASSFINDPYQLDGNRIIWKKSDYVEEFENCNDAESCIINFICDSGDACGIFIEFSDSKAGAIDNINNYIKDLELDKSEDEDDEMLLEELHEILDDLNKNDVKNELKSSLHR